MSDDPKIPTPVISSMAGARPGLRLVRNSEPASAAEAVPLVGAKEAATATVKAGRRSPFLDFMNSYSDAIDQQVKILLDL